MKMVCKRFVVKISFVAAAPTDMSAEEDEHVWRSKSIFSRLDHCERKSAYSI